MAIGSVTEGAISRKRISKERRKNMGGTNRVDLLSSAGPGNGNAQTWAGGAGLFIVEADFSGGGSVKLQFQSPNQTWIDYPSGSLSANGGIEMDLPPGQVRAVVVTAVSVFASLTTTPRVVSG